MTYWLGMDTATDVAGVALHDGVAVLEERTWATRRHTQGLAPAVAEVLRRHGVAATDLDGVAVAIGPGSYTGLRVGVALAKGLAVGAGVAVVGVPTLDILAAPLSPPVVGRDRRLWALLRAGRGRVVAAAYPPAAGGWPEGDGLVPEELGAVLGRGAPGDWMAGELTAEERGQALRAGFVVLPPTACLRRPGWLAELGIARAQGAPATASDLAHLEPIYPQPRSTSG
ncbi:MAG: tRNA (adenosine(37)-N6)-threonylcarbamoyltransferase complex dimerization subunit type 1 TsaB [Anaerolineae bacterium]